jgi:16S rRNA (guanine527-N7)-methyltransferase
MSQSALAAGLATLGLDLPAAAQQKLLAFRDLLLKWNKTYNLTALRDPAASDFASPARFAGHPAPCWRR